MTGHLQRDLALLKDRILGMGGRVEEAVDRAHRALVERRPDLAHKVIAEDRVIDEIELAVDEECLKILALHQPVAGDLRFITSVMKINNDLERIADLAVNIAERALVVCAAPPLDEPLRFEAMAALTRRMLRDSLDALVSSNAGLARDVCRRDDEVDAINRSHFDILIKRMHEDPDSADIALSLLTSSLHIERVADLATNIAEDVVFMVEAVVIRHHALPEAVEN